MEPDPALSVYPWPWFSFSGEPGAAVAWTVRRAGGWKAAFVLLSYLGCAAGLEVRIRAENSGCSTGRRTWFKREEGANRMSNLPLMDSPG